MLGSEGISSVMELCVVGVSSGAVSQQLYPLNFAKLLMASISFGARIQIRIETFVFNVFFLGKWKRYYVILCFLDHKQRCYFLIEQVKYCVIIKTGDTNLYLVFSFLSIPFSPFAVCSPNPGKLFYLISDKTLLNQNHFLLLSNCYITRVARQGEGKGEFVAASEKNSICLIV